MCFQCNIMRLSPRVNILTYFANGFKTVTGIEHRLKTIRKLAACSLFYSSQQIFIKMTSIMLATCVLAMVAIMHGEIIYAGSSTWLGDSSKYGEASSISVENPDFEVPSTSITKQSGNRCKPKDRDFYEAQFNYYNTLNANATYTAIYYHCRWGQDRETCYDKCICCRACSKYEWAYQKKYNFV